MFTKRISRSRLVAPVAGILLAVAPVAYAASTGPDDTHSRSHSYGTSAGDTRWQPLADTHWSPTGP